MDSDQLDMAKTDEGFVVNSTAISFYDALLSTRDDLSLIKDLEDFCKEAEKFTQGSTEDVVRDFLNIPDGHETLLNLLKNGKLSSTVCAHVFQALRCLLLRLSDDLSQLEDVSKQLIERFVQLGMQQCCKMLSGKKKEIRATLQLLTLMVAFGKQPAKYIIVQYGNMSKDLCALAKIRNLKLEFDIRTSLIHFIMSFLISGSPAVIRQICEDREVISAIILGLPYDKDTIIQPFLLTFKEKVLENPNISKTIKIRLLNEQTLPSIFMVLQWKGAKVFTAKKQLKKNRLEKEAWILQEATSEQIDIVQDCAFEFLLTVCTSHKFGIIFNESHTEIGGNPNHLITKILLSQEDVFHHAKSRELLAKIMCSCPGQMQYYLPQLRISFEPRPTLGWFQAMKFITEVASLQDTKTILSQGVGEKNNSNVIRKFQNALGFFVLTRKVVHSALKDKTKFVKQAMAEWLIIILRKLNSLLSQQEKTSNPQLNTSLIRKALLKFLPALPELLPIFLGVDSHVDKSPLVIPEGIQFSEADYLTSVIDLLLLYCEDNQNTKHVNMDIFQRMFSLIQKCSSSFSEDTLAILRLKILKVIAAVSPRSYFQVYKGDNLESPLYMIFLLLITMKDESAIAEIKSLLVGLFSANESFYSDGLEVEVWMNELVKVPAKKIESSMKLLFQSVQNLFQKPNSYVEKVTESKNRSVDDTQHVGMEIEGLKMLCTSNNIPVQKNVDQNVKAVQRPHFSPLVPAVLDNFSEDDAFKADCKEYILAVLLHFIHHQSEPKPLIILLETYTDALPKFLTQYTYLWSSIYFPSCEFLQEHLNYWQEFIQKMLYKEEASVKNYLIAAFLQIHTDFSQDPSRREVIIHFLQKAKPESVVEAKSLLDQSLFYLQSFLLNVSHGRDFDDGIMILISYMDSLISYICSFLDESSQCEIVLAVLARPFFKTWFLTISDMPSSPKVVSQIEICCHFVTAFIGKCFLFISNYDHVFDGLSIVCQSFKDKLAIVWKRTFTSRNEIPVALWNNLKIASMGCRKMLTIVEAANLLNFATNLEPSMLLLLCDVVEILQELLSRIINSAGEVVFQILKKQTVKALFDVVLLCETENEKNGLEKGLLVFLEQNPTYSVSVDIGCFQGLLEKGSATSLQMVKVLINHNPVLCSSLNRWLLVHQSYLVLWPAPLSLQILTNAFQSSDVFSIQEGDLSSQLSKMYWQCLSSFVIGGEPQNELLWESFDLKFTLSRLLQKQLIQPDSLEVVVNQVLQESMTSEVVPTLNRLDLVTQIFECINEYQPSYQPQGMSLMSSLFKMHLHWLNLLLSTGTSKFLILDFVAETLNMIESVKKEDILLSLPEASSFIPLVVLFLKKGLKCGVTGPSLLLVLKELCFIIYEKDIGMDLPAPNEILKLILGHSEFLKIMVDEENILPVLKEPIINLMITLVSLDGSCCYSEHFPILLSAYQASMSPSDQKLLYLMSLYEKNGVSMHGFRPFLWGPSAMSYYTSQVNSRLSLWNQPKLDDFVHLLSSERLIQSSLKFPLELEMQPKAEVFRGEILKLTESELHSVYDPRFLLLLFSHFLVPGSVVDCEKFITSKCLAYVVASLSSQDDGLRALGYHTMWLFYQHLENKGHINKIWLFILDYLRNAFNSPNVKLSFLVATFLIKASDVLFKPKDALFGIMSRFFSIKPEMTVSRVPEFYKLFYSSDMHHNHHRTWFISFLLSGLRTSQDFHLCQKHYIFQILLAYCPSGNCPIEQKILILQTLRQALQIRSAALSLCKAQGLLPWIQSFITSNISASNEHELLTEIVLVLQTLWQTSKTKPLKKKRPHGKQKANLKTEVANSSKANESKPTDLSNQPDIEDFMDVDDHTVNADADEVDLLKVDQEIMDNEEQPIITADESSPLFYSTFLNECFLICLSLLENIGSHPDPITRHGCLKLSLECFIVTNSEPFLLYLTDRHLKSLMASLFTSETQEYNGSDSPSKNSITQNIAQIKRESNTYALQVMMFIPPRISVCSASGEIFFQALNCALQIDHLDFEFVNYMCNWLSNCVQIDKSLKLINSESCKFIVESEKLVDLLLESLSDCLPYLTTGCDDVKVVNCVSSLIKLFVVLLPQKEDCYSDIAQKIQCDFEAAECRKEKIGLTQVAFNILDIWLEDTDSVESNG